MALAMLLITSLLSYTLYRMYVNYKRSTQEIEDIREQRERRRQYYLEQRERARAMMREFDLTDEEIEERLDREFGPDSR